LQIVIQIIFASCVKTEDEDFSKTEQKNAFIQWRLFYQLTSFHFCLLLLHSCSKHYGFLCSFFCFTSLPSFWH